MITYGALCQRCAKRANSDWEVLYGMHHACAKLEVAQLSDALAHETRPHAIEFQQKALDLAQRAVKATDPNRGRG